MPGGLSPIATFPATLPAQTWGVLSDQAAGLSILYPASWSSKGDIAEPGGVIYSNFDTKNYGGAYLIPPLLSVSVSIEPNPQQLSPGDYYNTKVSGLGADTSGVTTTSTTTLANQDGLEVLSQGVPGSSAPSDTYYLPDGSLPNIVVIRVVDPGADSQHVADRMLASLTLSQ